MKKKFEHRELEGALFLHFYINVALKIIICNKSFLCARYTSERSKIKVILLALLDHIAKTRIYAQAKSIAVMFSSPYHSSIKVRYVVTSEAILANLAEP